MILACLLGLSNGCREVCRGKEVPRVGWNEPYGVWQPARDLFVMDAREPHLAGAKPDYPAILRFWKWAGAGERER